MPQQGRNLMPDDDRRFFLGYGERLTERVAPPPGGGGPDAPYELDEAISRLGPRISATAASLQELPSGACPEGQAVGLITMHPQAIAKSYHPRQLLDQLNLRQVGSRPVQVLPDKWTRQAEPEVSPSTQLFVAGRRESFASWSENVDEVVSSFPIATQNQLRRIEDVRAPQFADRYRGPDNGGGERELFEVVIHASSDPDMQFIVSAFQRYARSLDAVPDLDRRLYAGGLCFLPVDVSPKQLPS